MFLSYHQKNNCQAFWVKITWTAAEKPVKCRVWHRLLNRHAKTDLRSKRRFLRFARNLRPHWFGEGKRAEYFFNFGGFCLLSVSRASVSEGQVDKNQTSALVLLLDVLIHENENSLFFFASIIAVWLRLTLSGTFKCSNAHPIYSRSHSNLRTKCHFWLICP